MRYGCFLIILVLSTQAFAADPARVEYLLRMPEPWTHLFEVEMAVAPLEASRDSLDFVLPVWRAGRYIILDFAGGVVRFEALGLCFEIWLSPSPWAARPPSGRHRSSSRCCH